MISAQTISAAPVGEATMPRGYKDPDKNREYQREWAAKRYNERKAAGTRRDKTLQDRYGITEAEWNATFESQGRRCAICRTDAPKSKVGWHTDHDHKTRRVRGILCEHCNRGLGMYADDIVFILRAASYLGMYHGILTGREIERDGVISPFVPRGTSRGMSYGSGSSGYDIRLDQDITLPPKGFSLGSSMEYFDIPHDMAGLVFDKSSHARRGLSLFNTIAEAGWRGYLTLELFNASNETIELKAGDPIGQVIFMPLDEPTEQPYTGKYQDQARGPQPAISEPIPLPEPS